MTPFYPHVMTGVSELPDLRGDNSKQTRRKPKEAGVSGNR
jgi:hypothetical protein